MKDKMVIIILGAPGAGKGTQAKLLQKNFDLKYVGSGELLRARKKKEDFTGIKIGKFIDFGKWLSTPVIFNLWMNKMEAFKKNDSLNGFIMDGSPRSLFEAEMLQLALEWYEWVKNKKVIF